MIGISLNYPPSDSCYKLSMKTYLKYKIILTNKWAQTTGQLLQYFSIMSNDDLCSSDGDMTLANLHPTHRG